MYLIVSLMFVRLIAGREKSFEPVSEFNGMTCSVADIVLQHTGVSSITCSAICFSQSTCIGVFYTPSTQLCTGCGLFYTNVHSMDMALSSDSIGFYNPESSGWAVFQGSMYKIFPESTGFENARDVCLSQSSYLVHIDSSDEQNFLAGLMANYAAGGFFIGLRRITREDSFMWINYNSIPNFSHWDRGEPNGETCAVVRGDRINYTWNDVECNTWYGFACEKDIN